MNRSADKITSGGDNDIFNLTTHDDNSNVEMANAGAAGISGPVCTDYTPCMTGSAPAVSERS
jgi:hypothetical protein